MRNRLLIVIIVIAAFGIAGCATRNQTLINKQRGVLNSITITRIPQYHYYNLVYGVDVRVITSQPQKEVTGLTHHLSGKDFFFGPTQRYVQSMGLVEKTPNQDYRLYITLLRVDVDGTYGDAWVDLEVCLKDCSGKEIFVQRDISTTSKDGWTRDINKTLNEAYTQALEQINWNRIASFLRTELLAKEEPQKQVQGYGDTALEQTIIRWDVQSRPQGADVFWRVVSKNPEVKSTNNKYLQTTPYEATKALDIKGLTYQTSSNVRIILRCEKDGYMSQEKEFDVRMVLDQEEISAFFRLVKEE